MDEILELLRKGVAIRDRLERGRLVLLGEDRIRFLQGQATQRVDNLAEWSGAYTTFVSHKGRMEGDGYIYVMPEEVLLDLCEGTGSAIKKRLEDYIVSDDVEVVDAGEYYTSIGLHGKMATVLLEKAGIAGPDSTPSPNSFEIHQVSHPEFGELYISSPDNGLGLEYDIFVTKDYAQKLESSIFEVAEKCDFPSGELTESQWASIRIHGGVPQFGIDLTEGNLPPEAGLDKLGISYNKGCYIGQEVLNRLRAMGSVTRRLVGVTVHGLKIHSVYQSARGLKLSLDGRNCGVISSLIFSSVQNEVIGLAMVKKPYWEKGQRLDVEPGGLETSDGNPFALVCELPFIDFSTD